MANKQVNTPSITQSLKSSFPSLLMIISFICLISGMIGIIFVESQPDKSFDIRQQASTETEADIAIVSPQADRTLSIEPNQKNTVSLDITSSEVEKATVAFFISSKEIENPEISVPDAAYTITSSEIEQTKDGYAVSVELAKTGETQTQPALNLTFTANQAGTAFISFDSERTTAQTISKQTTISSKSFSVKLSAKTQPIVDSSRQTSTTSAETSKPTPTIYPDADRVSPRPSVRPSPSPSPTVGACNQTCSTNAQCPTNHLCYNTGSDKRCRLVTNPSSTSCVSTPDNGLNRQCNQYCADNRECGSGLSCWFNRCRRPDNIESTSCSRPSLAKLVVST